MREVSICALACATLKKNIMRIVGLHGTLESHEEGTLTEAVHHLAPKGLVNRHDKNVSCVVSLFRITLNDMVYLRYQWEKKCSIMVHGLGGEGDTPLETDFQCGGRKHGTLCSGQFSGFCLVGKHTKCENFGKW